MISNQRSPGSQGNNPPALKAGRNKIKKFVSNPKDLKYWNNQNSI